MKNLLFWTIILFFTVSANASELNSELISRTAFSRSPDVQYLLEQGANPNALNHAETPIIVIAAKRSDTEAAKIVKLLVENGGDYNLRDSNGDDALTAAIEYGTAETIEVLLSYNPAMRRLNARNQTLVELAEKRADPKILKLVQDSYNAEQERIAFYKSDKNFRKLIKEYSIAACGEAYWKYYSNLGDEKKEEDTYYQNKITESAKNRNTARGALLTYFDLSDYEYRDLAQKSMKAVLEELHGYPREFERRAAKIGQEEDADRRCTRIGESISRKLKRRIEK